MPLTSGEKVAIYDHHVRERLITYKKPIVTVRASFFIGRRSVEQRHGREGERCTEMVISAVMDERPGYNERHVQ